MTVALVSRVTPAGSIELIMQPLVREYRGLLPPQEVHGWRDVFDGMLDLGLHRLGGKVLVVVDSDLGQHDVWNRRARPLLPPNYYLPAGFTLTYAAADRERGALFNRLMLVADRFANEILERVRKNERGVEGLVFPPLGAPFTYFRDWEIADERLIAEGFSPPSSGS